MAYRLRKELIRVTSPVSSYACHHIGAAEAIRVQVDAHSSQIYCPSPEAAALVESLSDSHLSELAVKFEAFAGHMASSGCSNYYETLQDFLEDIPALQRLEQHRQQQWGSSADITAVANDPWPIPVTVQPVAASHRSYSPIAAALQLQQPSCVTAARTFYPGDPIGPYYSIAMPADLHHMAFWGAEPRAGSGNTAKQPICVALSSKRITFDASCCIDGDYNKLAELLDYRCFTASGSHAPDMDYPDGPNAAFLVYVDSTGWPWLFVVALRTVATGEEICIDYSHSHAEIMPEAHREQVKYSRVAKLQLQEQLQPIMQRLRTALDDVQSAMAKAGQQQLQQHVLHMKLQQHEDFFWQQQQHGLIKAARSSSSWDESDMQLQQQRAPAKAFSKQPFLSTTPLQLQQQPVLHSRLIGGLLNLSLQVLQLEQIVDQQLGAQGSGVQPAVTKPHQGSAPQLPLPAVVEDTAADTAAAAPAGQMEHAAVKGAKELPELVLQLLDSSSAELQLQAVRALEVVCLDAANRQCLVSAGAVLRLVQLVRAGSTISGTSTCPAGSTIGNPMGGKASFTTGSTFHKAGSSTVNIRMCNEAVQAAAAATLGHLAAGSAAHKDAVIAAGAISPLVHLLGSENESCQINAAVALTNLASSAAHRKAVATEPEAVQGLTILLSSSSTAVQEAAAAAVKNITDGEAGRRAVDSSADPILLLVQVLVSSRSESVKQCAAGALSNLAYGNPVNQKLIAAAPGALGALVKMLTSFSEASQKPAVAALASLTAGSPDKAAVQATPGAVSGLVWLLGSDNPSLQTISAAALGGLCAGSVSNKESVAEFPGAIPGLVSLLFSAYTSVQAAAAATLSNLAAAAGIKEVIKETPSAVGGFVQLLMTNHKEVQQAAATALSNLASGSSFNRQAILGIPGVTSRLAKLLGSSSVAVQVAAAAAIANLASDIVLIQGEAEIQAMIAELITAQRSSGSSRVQVAAAAARKRLRRGLLQQSADRARASGQTNT